MYRAHVLVCGGTGCTSSGSAQIIQTLEDEIKKNGLQNEISVVKTGCHGLCAEGPVMIVYPEAVFYSQVKPEDVPEIVMESVLAAAMDVRGTVPEIAGAVPDVPEAVLVLAAVVPVPVREPAKTAVQQAAPALVPVPVQAVPEPVRAAVRQTVRDSATTPAPPTVKLRSSLTLGTTSPSDTLSWPWIIPNLKTRWITSIAAEEKRSRADS